MIVQWELLHPRMTDQHLGYLAWMLNDENPAKAVVQLDQGYRHGGGWHPFNGHTLNDDNSLSYPGDPDMRPVAQAKLRDELILLYPHDWVAVIQPDRSFEVCRMD
jgi:hypothetical protein